MLKLGIIGAGNIIKTRHLPALKKNRKLFSLVGIIDGHGNKAKALAKVYGIPNYANYFDYKDFAKIPWFQDVEAVLIGTPPKEHAMLIEMALKQGKHVLVEKPFVVDMKEGQKLIKLAKDKGLILAVNHNFQFSNSFLKLKNLVDSGELGKVKSFYSVQVSNDQRRLPKWGDDLPLGLFYDESPHVFYLLKRFAKAGVELKQVYKVPSKVTKGTPKIINMDLEANKIPISIYINFESPVNEWSFMIFGDKKFAAVDLFRDILTVLPNDTQHLMKEVFISSFLGTWSHWKGFFLNGIRYVQQKLYYGMDITHKNFYDAVINKDYSYLEGMTGEDGLEVNRLQHEVVKS